MDLDDKVKKLKKLIYSHVSDDDSRRGLMSDLTKKENYIDGMLDFFAQNPDASRDEIFDEVFILLGYDKVKMIIADEE